VRCSVEVCGQAVCSGHHLATLRELQSQYRGHRPDYMAARLTNRTACTSIVQAVNAAGGVSDQCYPQVIKSPKRLSVRLHATPCPRCNPAGHSRSRITTLKGLFAPAPRPPDSCVAKKARHTPLCRLQKPGSVVLCNPCPAGPFISSSRELSSERCGTTFL
jgi:hypothetical protein